jgi:hypothetical protein
MIMKYLVIQKTNSTYPLRGGDKGVGTFISHLFSELSKTD